MLKTLLASKIVRLAIVILAIILAIFLIMLGIFVYSRPWDRAMFIDPVTKIDTQDKLIALTFDDGPSAKTTPALLDLLDKYEIKATFFVLGKNIEDHPEIAQNIYDSGHLLGNHSYDHPRFLFKTPSYTADQINKTDQLISALGQEEVEYFRPPYSFSYVVLPIVLNQMDKTMVNGSYDPPAEYERPFIGQKVADQIISNAEPGSIIYLHDTRDDYVDEFIYAVEATIIELQSEGYTFVTLQDQSLI